jgi:regulation of enolase protein 1 (concanavalin A-like superfamily)
VSGSGLDINGTSDQFRYVYQTLTNDGQITARTTAAPATSPYAQAGVMIRESTAPNSANATLVITGGNRLQFQRRLSTGATTSYTSWTQAPPQWLRLVRASSNITAYRSPDGVTWTNLASYAIPMASTVTVGLVVSSHDNTVLGTGTFDNVAVAVSANALPSVSITGPAAGSSFTDPASITISASASDSDGSISRVDFYDGPTLLGSATSSPYSYSWPNPPPGGHSLTARATDNSGATTISTAVGITVSYSSGSLPFPWTDQDVGAVGLPGSASYAGGTFTVNGSGLDIAGTSDQFHYAFQTLAGDGQITARITSVQNTNANSKGGIMIRESTAANAANATLLVTGGSRLQFQRRLSTGGTTPYSSWSLATPIWVRLVRAADTITGYRSSDGVSWTNLGTFSIPMAGNVTVGLVMSSHVNTVVGTATFDNVSKSP